MEKIRKKEAGMTNGEKIKETFPNMRITVCEFYIQVMGEKYEFNNTYPLDWWNAEYQEPRKGHWKIVPYEDTYYCSECNLRLDDEQTYIPLNYCPKCGAKMEVEK